MTENPATPEIPEAAVSPAGPLPEAPPVRKDRRVLRAVLRWTAATVVFATVGAAAAYGITEMRRTDVPGLATASDGRWNYPEIQYPPLPSGSPSAFAETNRANVHHADLRRLLLPVPEGAKADEDLRGTDGWLPKADFLDVYASKGDRDHVGRLLTDYALRHIAARGWTTPDGTRTRIYLLRFDSAAIVDSLQQDELTSWDSPNFALRGAADVHSDGSLPQATQVEHVPHYAYEEAKPYGAEQVRQAYLVAGDTLGLIVQSRKGSAPKIPFQQTVVLQSQLLG
ncbi:hypothetical protein CW362_27645 [Streptomyces populi]|uniref:Uncharacterized protein n=1 Tax=Streptomyces populi TaxID=2058924 RepID=A0A2I0SIL3_9ACTN|nr:hypothetical protein [Streptomyces populi]PKT69775.1 hypothetical protein CW362_27645 [Streptomyces populi]